MIDQKKTKAQLINELEGMRRRMSNMEQHVSALESERERWRQTELFYRAGLSFHQTVWTDKVFDAILEQVGQIVPHNAASIMLVDNGLATVARWQGYRRFEPDTVMAGSTFDIAATYTLRTMQETKRALVIPEVEQYPEWVQLPGTAWIKSYVGVPLFEREELIGFLNINSSTPNTFGQTEADRLHAFARQAAVALKNAHLYFYARHEIGERVRALKKERNFISTLLDTTDAIVILLNRAGRIIRMNQAAEQITGYRFDDVKSLFYWDVFLRPDDAAAGKAYLEELRENYSPVKYESIIQTRDRDIRQLICAASVLVDSDDQVEFIIFTGINITERREAEERFRQFVLSISDHIYVTKTDEAGVLKNVYISPQVEELTGSSPEYFMEDWALWSSEFIHPEDREAAAKQAAQLAAGKDSRMEYRLVQPNGEVIWVRDSARVISNEPSKTIFGVIADITSQKKSEAELRHSQQFLQAILNAMSAHMAILDDAGHITVVNDAWRRYADANDYAGQNYGVGQDYIDICDSATGLYSKEAKLVAAGIRQVMSGDHDYFYLEYPCPAPTEKKWTGMKVTRFTNGGASWVIIAHEDITERKLVEEALRSSEEKYRTLTDQLPIGVYRTTPGGKILYANPTLATMLGYKNVTELEEISVGQLFVESRVREDQLAEWQASGQIMQNEMQLKTRDGRNIWVRDTGRAILDEQGNIDFLDGTLEDITARRHAEERLRLLATAIRSTEEGVLITDARLELPGPLIVFANDGICQMSGYSKTELIGQSPRIFQGKKTSSLIRQEMKSTLASGQSFIGEGTNYRKNESEYRVSWHISPVSDSAGKITHFVAIVRDVTKWKQLEAQLHQSQKMDAIGRLAGGVAHDFNNLLTVIKGYTEFLLDGLNEADPLCKDIIQIDKACDRATALTRQLLVFSRKEIVKVQPINLNDIVSEMEKMLRRLIGEHINLVIPPASTLGKVNADPGQMEQIIMNLVVNARDAMPRGGQLTIETANVELSHLYVSQLAAVLPGPYVRLSVSDTGTGIDEETLSHIFEPFFTTKGQGKGTGLGLSTVYAIITQGGGDIWVESAPEQGTTFRIYLPRLPAEEMPPGQMKKRGLTDADRGTETIMLVEDEPQVRALTLRLLQKKGYTVLEASHGHEALSISQHYQHKIDLIITDVVMPGGLGGRELVEKLQETRPRIKVLYMSGYIDDIIIQHGISHKNMAFIQKPFAPATMARKVRKILRGEDSP